MEEWLIVIARAAVSIINAMALLIIAYGALEAFLTAIPLIVSRSKGSSGLSAVFLRFARLLVAGLTFQLASNIIESSIAPTWDEIGRLGAIAVLRTFVDYFLERDVAKGVEDA
jgi:uncharacterized membrane protein